MQHWKHICVNGVGRLGLFWRFLIVMLFSSLLGLILFIFGTNLYGAHQLVTTLSSEPFSSLLQTQLRLIERQARPASYCYAAARVLAASDVVVNGIPAGGPNGWKEMASAGRLMLTYSVGTEQICSYPDIDPVTNQAFSDALMRDPDARHFSLLLSNAHGLPAETMSLTILPLTGWRVLAQASKEMPWQATFIFITFINFCSVLTLAPLLVRRIKRAEAVARNWTEGNLQARIIDDSCDEFGNLVHSFNHLADSFVDVIKIKQELAASEERNRVARDLHDTAKQRAFALNLQLTAVKSLGPVNSSESTRLLSSALALVQHLQNDLSNVIKRLSGTTITEMGFRDVLTKELSSLFDGSGIRWYVQVNEDVNVALAAYPYLAQQVFLIALEASANVLRHAEARQVRLQLSASEQSYTLLVVDDGNGFASLDPGHFGMGLANMRLRARALPGGEFLVSNNQDGGATVLVCFQLQQESCDVADSNAG